MANHFTQHLHKLTEFLGYSSTCPLCTSPISSEQALICSTCYQALPWHLHTNNQAPTPLISVFAYASPIKQLILEGKNSKTPYKLQLLAALIEQKLPNLIKELPEAILPVPLHPKRLRERSFNQSVELVRSLAKTLNRPLLLTQIIRQRHTDEQKKLSAHARQHNLERAFQLVQPIQYKHVAIFDDVVTTGATCAELEALLIDHGVEKIQIWCCAQTKMT